MPQQLGASLPDACLRSDRARRAAGTGSDRDQLRIITVTVRWDSGVRFIEKLENGV